MGVMKELKKLGGCSGGVAIYNAAKIAAYGLNVLKRSKEMPDKTKKIMKPLFPNLKLGKVRYRLNAKLPANWFKSNVDAMTFGYTIFFNCDHIHKNHLNLLMHELVHVDQFRRLGESEKNFACKYGEGFLKSGSYEKNPMEVEATEFVNKHRI